MPSFVETAIRNTVTKGVMAVAKFNRERMPEPETPNSYLVGVNAPMGQELTLSADQLKVVGQIPSELNGRYLRIGPNPLLPPRSASHHWFLGDGMVHGLRLQNGQAQWYRNRWIRSNAVSQALGEAPAPGPRRRSDTVNTNVVGHAGKSWALVEAGGYPVELGDELQTVAHNPFEGSLKGSFSAHPHLDVATGDWHAVCYEATDPHTLRHVVVGADGRVQREEPIAVRHGPSVHDCMITEHHVIVLDLPVTFSMSAVVAGYGFPYEWNPKHPARVGVLGKNAPGSSIVWCEVEPCYVFHPCNAFETADGRITMDVVAHASMFEGNMNGPSSKGCAFERWTIDPSAQRVQRQVLDSAAQEFPRADERLTGQPYRYAYSAGLQLDKEGQFESSSQLFCHDLQAGTKLTRDFGPACHVGEFVFQPRHAKAAENDGWLMGYVVNMATQTTDFVILNAADVAGAPVAVVTIPHRIPAGFHGNWVPDRA